MADLPDRRPSPELPATIERLHRYVLIGKEVLKAHRARLRAIDKIPDAQDFKVASLQDGQKLAELVLEAEVKLGEMLAALPQCKPIPDPSHKGRVGGSEPTLPSDISWKESHQAQTLAAHPGIVEEVKLAAQKEGRLATAREVYREIKKAERENRRHGLGSTPWPEGKWRVILADPPWKYGDERVALNKGYGPAEAHYPTMAVEEICALKVPEITLDNAVLFLWVTSPMLEEASKVIRAWGFVYKASFIWDKVGHNYGHYNSVRHELLLVSTKGSCLPDSDRRDDSVISIEKNRVHSQKPEAFYELIERLYPHGPKMELFLRGTPRPGWFGWGNEAHR